MAGPAQGEGEGEREEREEAEEGLEVEGTNGCSSYEHRLIFSEYRLLIAQSTGSAVGELE